MAQRRGRDQPLKDGRVMLSAMLYVLWRDLPEGYGPVEFGLCLLPDAGATTDCMSDARGADLPWRGRVVALGLLSHQKAH